MTAPDDRPSAEELLGIMLELDTMPEGDPEAAHHMADRLLLQAVHPEIAAAYRRLVERCEWWACA